MKWFIGILIAIILSWTVISPGTVQFCMLGETVLCYIAVLVKINSVNRKLDEAVKRIRKE